MSVVSNDFFFFPEKLANIFPEASLMRLCSTWPWDVSLLMIEEFQKDDL